MNNTLCGRPLKFGDTEQIKAYKEICVRYQKEKKIKELLRSGKIKPRLAIYTQTVTAECPHCNFRDEGGTCKTEYEAFNSLTNDRLNDNGQKICSSCNFPILK